ncbi:MAG TPA: response regulator transcription factor [Bacteroidales bacterium]|nr:response regulator transcription factor [Bacteroidales bacterium]
MNKIKLILVDDHPIVRDGIFAALMNVNNIEIVGEASNSDELFRLLDENKVKADVVLLDLSMPKMSGTEITKILKEKHTNLKVLIFSSYTDEDSIFSSIQAGALGYLPKDAMRDELVSAIEQVYQGQEYLSKSIPNTILMKFINKSRDGNHNDDNKLSMLTKRELEILKHIAEGMHYKEIGDKLYISARTVETHKNNIMQKLGLNSTIELVKYAIKNRVIEL